MARAAQIAGVIIGAALMLAATSAGAETPLPAFSGKWTGHGSDRDTPFESLQPTQCRVTVKADRTHMASDTNCNGVRGLSKRFHMTLAFTGHAFTGKAEQTSRRRGDSAAATRHSGTVSGSRSGDVADFDIHFGGLTPNAHVVLKLTSPTSFSMLVTALGLTLTDVSFSRPGR